MSSFDPRGMIKMDSFDPAHVHASLAAMVAVKQLSEQTGLRHGLMRCVKCMKGEIAWSVNGKKGHTSGKCSTPNCVQWIE